MDWRDQRGIQPSTIEGSCAIHMRPFAPHWADAFYASLCLFPDSSAAACRNAANQFVGYDSGENNDANDGKLWLSGYAQHVNRIV